MSPNDEAVSAQIEPEPFFLSTGVVLGRGDGARGGGGEYMYGARAVDTINT